MKKIMARLEVFLIAHGVVADRLESAVYAAADELIDARGAFERARGGSEQRYVSYLRMRKAEQAYERAVAALEARKDLTT